MREGTFFHILFSAFLLLQIIIATIRFEFVYHLNFLNLFVDDLIAMKISKENEVKETNFNSST